MLEHVSVAQSLLLLRFHCIHTHSLLICLPDDRRLDCFQSTMIFKATSFSLNIALAAPKVHVSTYHHFVFSSFLLLFQIFRWGTFIPPEWGSAGGRFLFYLKTFLFHPHLWVIFTGYMILGWQLSSSRLETYSTVQWLSQLPSYHSFEGNLSFLFC